MDEIMPGLFAKVTGKGPTMVLLHGVNVSHRSWGREFPYRLERAGYSLVMPDMPGFGISESLPDLATTTAEKIIAYLETLDSPVILVGHSYGGGVAIMIAHARPDLVSRLVLFAPGGCYPSPRARGRMEWLDGHVAHVYGHAFRISGEPFVQNHVRTLPHADYLDWDVKNTPDAIKSLVAANVDQLALAVTVPTFVIWGDSDKVVFPFFMKRLVARTGWEYHVCEKIGHLAPLQHPKECADMTFAWLRALEE